MELESALSLPFPRLPELPLRFPLASLFDAVLDERRRGLDAWLREVVEAVDPEISSQSLREFLDISDQLETVQPVAPPTRTDGCTVRADSGYLPAEVIGNILSYVELNERLVRCSNVSRSFRASTYNYRSSNITYSTDFVDRRQRGLFRLLVGSADALRRLELRLRYADERSRLCFPLGLNFPLLSNVKFATTEACSAQLFADLLLATDRVVELDYTGPVTSELLAAVSALDRATLRSFKVTLVEAFDNDETSERLGRVGGAFSNLRKLEIRKTTKLYEIDNNIINANCSLPVSIEGLKYDMLNETLLEDRVFAGLSRLTHLSLSGLRKHIPRVDHVLTRILPQLPSTLRHLALGVYEEADSDWLYRGYVPEAVGALDDSWSTLRDLRTLKLVGTALDNEGLVSIARNCRRLTKLSVICHLQFVTDFAVSEITANLSDLTHLALLGEVEWISDNSLVHLASVIHRSQLREVRLQMTRHMSSIGADALAAACEEGGAEFELLNGPVRDIFAKRAEVKLEQFTDSFARTCVA